MLTETGRVVAVDGDGLWVETIRSSTCGSCSAAAGCGHGLLNRFGAGHAHHVRVLPGEQAITEYAVNDAVRIAIPEALFLRAALLVYGLPLVCMMAGAIILPLVAPVAAVEWVAVAGAVSGLACGAILVRWHGWRHRNDRRLQPLLLGRATPPADDPVPIA